MDMARRVTKAPAPAILDRTFSPATLAGLDQAAEHCWHRDGQLTELRRLVLGILLQKRAPMGAYEIIQLLSDLSAKMVGPPTIYRAMDFLIEMGLVARVASRNAFVACAHPDHAHDCVFFICQSCGGTQEIEDQRLDRLIREDAKGLGFEPMHRVLEIEGTCRSCRAG
jgi:Fur family transcriptional regulator, zinc uptake regulator